MIPTSCAVCLFFRLLHGFPLDALVSSNVAKMVLVGLLSTANHPVAHVSSRNERGMNGQVKGERVQGYKERGNGIDGIALLGIYWTWSVEWVLLLEISGKQVACQSPSLSNQLELINWPMAIQCVVGVGATPFCFGDKKATHQWLNMTPAEYQCMNPARSLILVPDPAVDMITGSILDQWQTQSSSFMFMPDQTIVTTLVQSIPVAHNWLKNKEDNVITSLCLKAF